MKAGKPLPYIKTVRAKGKVYEYFVTGKLAAGKPVLARLPARTDPAFGRSYAAMVGHRHARENVRVAMTMRELSRAYQLSPKYRKRAERTQQTYLTYLNVVEAEMGDAPVAEVERRDVQALLDKMQDRPGAANMVLIVLRLLFAHAAQRDLIALNPTRDVPMLETDGDEHEPWPEQLVAAALADPEVRLPVALLYFTAQRIGDVCEMRWSHFQDGRVIVQQEKTDKPLEIRAHSTLAAILADAPREAETILHFRKRPIVRATLRNRLQRWAEKHECAIVPHGLRKNAVNSLLEVGCSVAETSAISGQSLAMVEHYAKRRNNRRLGDAAMDRWDKAEQR